MELERGHSIEDARELAALYALGTLPLAEASTYEQHLGEGCALCTTELLEMEATSSSLALLAPPEAPPAGLREKLLEQIRLDAATTPDVDPQVWKKWEIPGVSSPSSDEASVGWTSVPSDEGAWEETGLPGISVRRLFVDPVRNYVTMLVRAAPGASYPPHRHYDVEECFVLEGDLHVNDSVLHKGDYQRADAGSIHNVQWTEGGCTILIVSSTQDELLAR